MHISYISRRTQYLPLGEAYQVPIMSYAHTKRLPNALVEKVEGGLNNFKVRKTN